MFRLQDDTMRSGNQDGYHTRRYSFVNPTLSLPISYCQDVAGCMRARMVCRPETDIGAHHRQGNKLKSRD